MRWTGYSFTVIFLQIHNKYCSLCLLNKHVLLEQFVTVTTGMKAPHVHVLYCTVHVRTQKASGQVER